MQYRGNQWVQQKNLLVTLNGDLEGIRVGQESVPQWNKALMALEQWHKTPFKNFVFQKVLLYLFTLVQQGSRPLLCVPPSYRQCVLSACPDEVTAGLLGVRWTTDRI